MKGLMANNFYGAIDNIKLFFVFDALLSIVLLISGNPTLLNAFAVVSPPAIALFVVACLRKENTSKWGKYKLTFPVTRKAIVKCQYKSHLLWSLIAVAFVGVIIAFTVLIHGNLYFVFGLRDALSLIFIGFVLSSLLGTIAYPMMYFWGAERTEAIITISAVISIGILMALTLLINILFGSHNISNFVFYMSMVVILIIVKVLYVLSYCLSTRIFNSKEY